MQRWCLGLFECCLSWSLVSWAHSLVLEHFQVRFLQLDSLPSCSICNLNYRLLLEEKGLIQQPAACSREVLDT